MKKTMNLFVAAIAIMASIAIVGCKGKDTPVEPKKEVTVNNLNFLETGNIWQVTALEDNNEIPNDKHEKDDVNYCLDYNELGLKFLKDGTLCLLHGKTDGADIIWSISSKYITYDKAKQYLVIDFHKDIAYEGTVVLSEDKDKFYFKYAGEQSQNNRFFKMQGEILKKDFYQKMNN